MTQKGPVPVSGPIASSQGMSPGGGVEVQGADGQVFKSVGFVCEICDKVICGRGKSNLEIHLRTHTGERHIQNVKNTPTKNVIKVGDIVLVHDDIRKRINWPLARVTRLVFGNDGFVRSAEIKTKNGTTNRPITKLYPLEVRVEDVPDQKNISANESSPRDQPMTSARPQRQAAVRAKEKIANLLNDSDSD